MKLAPVVAIVTLLLLILTWLLTGGLNLNSARYDRELRALDDFSRIRARAELGGADGACRPVGKL